MKNIEQIKNNFRQQSLEKQEVNHPPAQIIFENARKMIKYYTGLDLKNSELVRLKNIAEEVRDQLEDDASIGWQIDAPGLETFHRFLFENYGIDISPLDRSDFFSGSKKCREDKKEWFKKQQDEMFKG